MNEKQIREVLSFFPKWRVPFYYFKDRYALMLLADFVGGGKPIRAVKASQFHGLLNKPVVKPIVKNLRSGLLARGPLDAVWPPLPEVYFLTLGEWGSHARRNWHWNQTSRPGKSLVLQLNFSSRHDALYEKLIASEDGWHPFVGYGHPVQISGAHTLAWARMDFDLKGESALIEEIQTDWVRFAEERRASWRRRLAGMRGLERAELADELGKLDRYVDQVLRPHAKLWDEAVLMAAIWFLREEIGLRRIYFHTYKSGLALKWFHRFDAKPPRSLYSRLPRRFCFRETRRVPRFLQINRARKVRKVLNKGGLRFFVLEK